MATTAIDDGGRAFPGHGYAAHRGMSLRDYFAARAMAAYISKLPIFREHDPRGVLDGQPTLSAEQGDEVIRGVANLAYRYAGAMIAERGRKPEPARPTSREYDGGHSVV